ncbi:MAG: hypothetical protein ACO3XO_08425 [Bdellovibrionota bacterium]|jgi:hypothetical protein
MRNYVTRNYQRFALSILFACPVVAPQQVTAQAALEGEEVLRDTVHHQEDALIGKLAEAAGNLASGAEAAMAREVRRDLHITKEESLPQSEDITIDSVPLAPSHPQEQLQDGQDPLVRIEEELQELPE